MNDRLAEIRRAAPPPDIVIEVEGDSTYYGKGGADKKKLLSNDGSGGGDSDFMKDFFSDIELVKQAVVMIKNSSTNIGDLNQAVSESVIASSQLVNQ